ncbi:hypothetical protein BRADI_1g23650v3 [Brachypodium distachyon]|uniref:Neprosin PEP catalytic domain-containing protein n=1 Tax=Brachypodium distachyon TaxID=15368 RepID=A0A0Q3KWK4_BRADI|nr:hypothetical protein BRADI_1g23650v3 [Brachypodium distachyon]
MGYSSLAAVLLLLFAGGTNAARLHRTSHEWAYHQMRAGDSAGYYGISATMDVYDFSLSGKQYSSAALHIFNEGDGAATSLHVIHIGWENDGLQKTRCVNTNCAVDFQPEPGAAIALGDVIQPVSQPNGVKQNITIKVIKQEPTLIGRFPKSLFNNGGLADRATHIYFGGVTVSPSPSTDVVPMGSGYLPNDNAMAAASFSNIQVINQIGQASLVTDNLPQYLSLPNTYAVTPVVNGRFFYGGPFQSHV